MANFSTGATNAVINKVKGAIMHIAIIMDGNGRWAQNKNLPRTLGPVSYTHLTLPTKA